MQRPSLEYAQRPVDVYRSNDNESISDPIYNLICSFNPSPPKKKENVPTTTKWGPTLYSRCLLVKYPNGHGLLQRLHPSSKTAITWLNAPAIGCVPAITPKPTPPMIAMSLCPIFWPTRPKQLGKPNLLT